MASTATSSAPILLNLNGQYVIPVEGSAPVAGSVSGDLRLAVLDSFLTSLANPLAKGHSGEQLLAQALTAVLAKCTGKTLNNSDVVLSITSTSDPVAHTMTHTLRFTVDPRR